MAATLEVSCPKCGKQLKVPAELEGKRVRCKDCQEIFPVKKGKPAAKAPPPPPEEPRSPFLDEDDDDNLPPGQAPKPMGVIAEDDIPRCPHCAKELDPPDAAVCKNCGFNNKTRIKSETKRVIAANATDWTSHLAPGIIAAILAIGLVVLDIVCAVNMREWMEGGMLESDEVDMTGRKKMYVAPGAFIAFITAATLVVIVPAVRFAIRRLIVNFKPEEKVKK
ncbi:MAG TPA: hypothetical protein VN641_16865 [Urbifossiella sp.]|nr:hypothetical protein [Urbifossiella sp.]